MVKRTLDFNNTEEFLQCVSLRIHSVHIRAYKCEIDYRNTIQEKKKQQTFDILKFLSCLDKATLYEFALPLSLLLTPFY